MCSNVSNKLDFHTPFQIRAAVQELQGAQTKILIAWMHLSLLPFPHPHHPILPKAELKGDLTGPDDALCLFRRL